jgi:TolA-binding protein
MRQNLFAFAVFASLLPFSAAQGQTVIQSQEGIALQNQIDQLQQQLQQVQQSQSSGGDNGGDNNGSALGNAAPAPSAAPPAGGIVASLLTQVQQLQAQVQSLSGRVDTLQNQVDTQHDATEKEIGDLKFAMTNGGAGAAGAAGAAAAGAGAAAAPESPSPSPPPAAAASPQAQLHAAQQAIIHGDYRTAESDTRAILKTSKTSPQSYQAQLILAEALYGEGRPQDAAIAFDDTYNHNRTGTYAPLALLGLANSLTSIHQAAAACDTLSSLDSQFPTPPDGLGPRIEAAKHRAHCN